MCHPDRPLLPPPLLLLPGTCRSGLPLLPRLLPPLLLELLPLSLLLLGLPFAGPCWLPQCLLN